MFITKINGAPIRFWEEGDLEPSDCTVVRDGGGHQWRKASGWKLEQAQLEAYGIPPGSTRWVTSEGDETFWADLFDEGPVREEF